MSKDLIYHATRNITPILESGALRSWYNLHGRDESQLRREYEEITSELAGYVRRYHESRGEVSPNLPNERLARIVGDTTFAWSPGIDIEAERLLGLEETPDFRENERFKDLIRKDKIFHRLIRGCYVYCGNFKFVSGFGNGNGDKYVLGINATDLETKDYLHAGDLVWWQIPINSQSLVEVHAENTVDSREILQNQGFGDVLVKEANFSERSRYMPFF